MINGVFNSTSIPLLEQVVRFSEERHKVLAGNVANIDTPGYQPRDLPVEKFQQALQDAIASRQPAQQQSAGMPDATQAAKPVDQFFTPDLFQSHTAAAQNITFQDGNNRSVEWGMMELQKNSGMQRFAIEVITSQLNMLQSVISERP